MSNLNGFTASNETILRECEAVEIERVFMCKTIDFAPHKLIVRVFDRINKCCNSFHFALDGVYLLGYIHGIRVERKRRKGRSGGKDYAN